MRIIPAIDIIDGKCVRLSQGDYAQKTVYNENPLEVAKQFEDAGLKYLHLVDLDGAKAKKVVNWKVLEIISSNTNLKVDFGGGLRTTEDLKTVFEAGAIQITAGSIAVNDRETVLQWISQFGAEKIILGADAKNGRIATHGWLDDSGLDAIDFISKYQQEGIEYVVCTDIAKDGMLAGPSIQLYKQILVANKGLKLIASGGVSSIKDLIELKEIGCEAAIVGKAFYEGRIMIDDFRSTIEEFRI
ncbi:MAG: 1-(5-phosphoribosyl)-5-[(5-phosphoribosylamino)methylideneamino]imidazole-4-carboxamide isomerase [Flavobacteriales bacterium]|nr:1-(5-phosphoribosyl)-5-[(5-phosphoribosylamino)methylideneamino]imidazole-4-carboxamide isomerase [Flavobacteriales bacterium]